MKATFSYVIPLSQFRYWGFVTKDPHDQWPPALKSSDWKQCIVGRSQYLLLIQADPWWIARGEEDEGEWMGGGDEGKEENEE